MDGHTELPPDELVVRITFADLHVIIGGRIRAAISAAGLSHAQVAAHLNKTRATVTAWLSGTNAVGLEDQIRLGRMLGVPHQSFHPLSDISAERRREVGAP